MSLIDYSLIDNFNSIAEQTSLRQAAGDFLKKLGISAVHMQGSFPETGPLLIISDHPTGLDSLTLLSIISRNDLYFVAQSNYHVYGPVLLSRLLPIYRPVQIDHFFFEYPLHFSRSPKREYLSLAETRIKNKESIAKAAKLISQGNAVSIFPMGAVGKKQRDMKWKIGLGYLVKQITHPEAQVVFVKIENTNSLDFLRYLHPQIRKTFFPKQERVLKVSKKFLLDDSVGKTREPKEIVKKLETKYNEYFKK